ncbi:MAG: orotidine-5'-phosphate decarboxylase [Ferruginibacter sp.]|nr:orotidine-5'-phosphate decarboxylase [Ferruginibacter sp.]
MERTALVNQIKSKQSFLCVGLDTDPNKIPVHLRNREDAIIEFNRKIIEATKAYCIAYKINTAFYEAMGSKGWEIMEQTVKEIPSTHLKIADAKRGDIGNTSDHYARAFFETIPFDAITVAPYMGADSIRPFLAYENKWTIVLGLTSNSGANDFEMQEMKSGGRLYEKVFEIAAKWGNINNLMFVAGATQPKELNRIRKIVPDNFLLVPGVGFQGGSLEEVAKHGMNKDIGLLVNVSRAIIYAKEDEHFAEEAAIIAQQYQVEMNGLMSSR